MTPTELEACADSTEALLEAGAPSQDLLVLIDRALARSNEADPVVRRLCARLMLTRVSVLTRQERLAEALDCGAAALHRLPRDPEAPASLHVQSLVAVAFTCLQLGLPEPALRSAFAGLQLALRDNLTPLAARALERIAMCYEALNAQVESQRFFLEALGTTLQSADTFAELQRLSNLLAFCIRRHDSLLASAQPSAARQALAVGRKYLSRGDTLAQIHGGYVACHWELNRGIAQSRDDDMAGAEARLQHCHDLSDANGWNAVTVYAAVELARIWQGRGELARAIALLTRDVCRENAASTHTLRVQAHQLLATLLERDGQTDAARAQRDEYERLQSQWAAEQQHASERLHLWEADVTCALMDADRRRLDAELDRLAPSGGGMTVEPQASIPADLG
jgi:tetratricopeptide (TPR) repeat protein